MRRLLQAWVRCVRIAAVGALCTLPQGVAAQGGPYVNFETIPTRAVALSPDGSRLFVTTRPTRGWRFFRSRPAG
jgi:hypothetical protein